MTDTLPGDPTPRQRIEQMIRVDHAGEFGAKQIYAGQLRVLGKGPKGDILRHMQAQEQQPSGHVSPRWSPIAGCGRRRCCRSGAWPASRWVR